MGRKVTIDEAKLLETARAVFAELGPEASTEVVAKRAGVSVGSLFRRWPTKDALLAAASRVEADPAWLATFDVKAGRGALRDELVDAGAATLDTFRQLLPALVLGWTRSPSRPDAATDPFQQAVRHVTPWFEAEMSAGRMRRADAEVAARTWLGALAQFALSERSLRLGDPLPISAHTFVRGLAELLLEPAPAPDVTQPTPTKTTRVPRRS